MSKDLPPPEKKKIWKKLYCLIMLMPLRNGSSKCIKKEKYRIENKNNEYTQEIHKRNPKGQ